MAFGESLGDFTFKGTDFCLFRKERTYNHKERFR